MNETVRSYLIFVLCFSYSLSQVIHEEVNFKKVKCLVCKQVMGDIVEAVSKVSPHITVNVGGYLLDSNDKQQSVRYRTSERFLTEVMENVCDKMDDYVKAKHRQTGEIMVIPLLNGGQMNTVMSEVDIIQDENLNKSLRLYCDEIVEDYDEIIIGQIRNGLDSAKNKVCDKVCEHTDYKTKDEL
ncbi:protein seele-like [Lycorma delicatula]|uniref:protein seele-like n=1 Tax=Lycorma delicatula TaxID=130591 RepID=UPI003F519E37